MWGAWMPLIDWDDSFCVGVSNMDSQHRILILRINELFDAMQAGHGKKMLKQTLSAMTAYTLFHFATEERFMKEANYPDMASHKEEHAYFIANVRKFSEEFEQGRTIGLSDRILSFLAQWLRNHIKKSDKQLGFFLSDKGMSDVSTYRLPAGSRRKGSSPNRHAAPFKRAGG